MAGGKGKSSGGKSSGGKTSAADGPKKQQSHSARAGLQVREVFIFIYDMGGNCIASSSPPRRRRSIAVRLFVPLPLTRPHTYHAYDTKRAHFDLIGNERRPRLFRIVLSIALLSICITCCMLHIPATA